MQVELQPQRKRKAKPTFPDIQPAVCLRGYHAHANRFVFTRLVCPQGCADLRRL
jgi:hypothetical protein